MAELPIATFEELMALFSKHFSPPAPYSDVLVPETRMNNRWYWDYVHFRAFCDLCEFRQWHDLGLVKNFIYDRKMGVVFLNFAPATHPQFMAALYTFHKLQRGDKVPTSEHTLRSDFPYTYCERRLDSLQDLAYEFLEEGEVMYVSSASTSKSISKIKTMKLTAQEKMVFRDYPIREL